MKNPNASDLSDDLSDLNVLFVHASIDEAGLNPMQFRVYCHLKRRAGRGDAFPAFASMAAVCQLHEKTIRKVLAELEGLGMLEITRRDGRSNLYRLTSVKKWKVPQHPPHGVEGVEEQHPPHGRGGHPPHGNTPHPPHGVGGEVYPPKSIQVKGTTTTATKAEEEAIVAAWNALPGLPKVKAVTAKRLTTLRARLKDTFFRTHWQEAIALIPQSSFLIGQNPKGWRADFDFFLQPDSVVKIVEGKYTSRALPSGVQRGQRPPPVPGDGRLTEADFMSRINLEQ